MYGPPMIIISLPPDLPESNCARPVAVGLLDTPSCRSRLPCSLGCQLLPAKGREHYKMVLRWDYLGAFPPVDFRAVCLVRAMVEKKD